MILGWTLATSPQSEAEADLCRMDPSAIGFAPTRKETLLFIQHQQATIEERPALYLARPICEARQASSACRPSYLLQFRNTNRKIKKQTKKPAMSGPYPIRRDRRYYDRRGTA